MFERIVLRLFGFQEVVDFGVDFPSVFGTAALGDFLKSSGRYIGHRAPASYSMILF